MSVLVENAEERIMIKDHIGCHFCENAYGHSDHGNASKSKEKLYYNIEIDFYLQYFISVCPR
jgi:hypothetical protein